MKKVIKESIMWADGRSDGRVTVPAALPEVRM